MAAVAARWGPSVAISALLLTRVANAQETRVRLAWARGNDGSGCLDQHGLEAGVRARLGRDPFAPDAPISIEGMVSRAGKAFRAELRVRDETGRVVGDRVIETPTASCDPLAEAVILAVALTIDPSAATRPGSAAAVPSSAPPPEDHPPLPPPVVACPAPPPCPAALPCPACPHAAPAAPRDVRVSASLRAVAEAGLLPKVAPGVGVAGQRVEGRFTLGVGVTWFPESRATDDRFSFGLTVASAGACYGAPVGAVRLDGCGEAQIGAMHAVLRDAALAPIDVGDQPWLSVAAGPRLSWGNHAPVEVEAGVLAIVPIIRKSFDIRGQELPFFSSAVVGGLAYVGLGFGGP